MKKMVIAILALLGLIFYYFILLIHSELFIILYSCLL